MTHFIPAKESSFFIRGFRIYTKWLFKRRFERVWIHQEFNPAPYDRTIYFLNHTSWWDGLIPFLLNEYCFHQQARAMMEIEQMQKYPFFKWMGTFSVDPAHTLPSLRYTLKSMQRPNSSLFIYPQGEIKPTNELMNFKAGLGWLYSQLPAVDFVPIGIRMHTVRHDKPELHLWIGEPLADITFENRTQVTEKCQNVLDEIISKLNRTAGFDDTAYEQFK